MNQPSPIPAYQLRLLGSCEFRRDKVAVHLKTVKTAALLAYLALQPQPQSRLKLMGLLWGDLPEVNARRNLRYALWNLRQEFNCPDHIPLILTNQQTIAINPQAAPWIDIKEFERRVANHDRRVPTSSNSIPVSDLIEAVDLYRGDLLDGFFVDGAPAFDEWLLVERERLRAVARNALQQLIVYYAGWGEYEMGLEYARRLLAMEPWLEEAHRQTMRLLVLSGQRSAALAQYETCRRILAEELNAEPSAETRALCESIRASAEPSPREPTTPPHNLPLPPTPFFGRVDELAQLSDWLANPTCRLVVLVGPGGIGKTQLALQMAMGAPIFRDGVFFVPLTGVASVDLLPLAIADTVHFTFRGSQSTLAQLLAHLREKEMLILLDNFEHLVSGAGWLEEILDAAPATKIVVTSRERLNLRQEWQMQVEGLDYPEKGPNGGKGPTNILPSSFFEQYSAMQLFAETMRRTRPELTIPLEDQSAMARICQLVEGMPLAIELAATATRTLSCHDLAQQIEYRLDALATSQREIPPRHRNMRAVFENSWGLLSEDERNTFTRLSVFRGGFRKSAAEAVAGASLSMLASLVAKSFLRRNPSGRYEVHELLRQFAEEKLTFEEKVSAFERHCEYYAKFLQGHDEPLQGPGLKEAMDEIGTEIDNVRAGWNWATGYQKLEEIGQFRFSLYRFYEMRNWFQEGEVVLGQGAQALRTAAPSAEASLLTAKLLMHQGRFCQRQSHFTKAKELLQDSLSIFRRLGERKYMLGALTELGNVTVMRGEYEETRRLYQEAITIYPEIDISTVAPLINLGYVACQMGQYSDANQFLQKALGIFEKAAHPEGKAFAIYYLGLVARGLENVEEAIRLFQNALALYHDLEHAWGMALCLQSLADIATESGEYDQAMKLVQEGLANAKQIEDAHSTALCLNRLGEIACQLKKYDEAKHYHQQAIRIAWKAEQPPPVLDGLVGVAMLCMQAGQLDVAMELLTLVIHHPATVARDKARAARLLAVLESQLPSDVIQLAHARGKTTKLEEIVAELLAGQFSAR